jgi:hypothetical protein
MKSQGWSGKVLLLASLLVLVGCGGGGSDLAPSVPGGGTSGGGTTPGPGGTPPPQPAATFTGMLTATYRGAPREGVTVTVSRGGSPTSSNIVATALTNAQGIATFPNLVSGVNYCYNVTFSPTPGTNVNGSTCSNSTAPARLDLG